MEGSPVYDSDVMARSEYALLQCAACNCNLCGKEFMQFMFTERKLEWFDLLREDPYRDIRILGSATDASTPFYILSFSSLKKRNYFEQCVLANLRRYGAKSVTFWRSDECFAFTPRSGGSGNDDPFGKAMAMRFSGTSYGEVSPIVYTLLVHVPVTYAHQWTYDKLYAHLCALFGSLEVKQFGEVFSAAAVEFVLESEVQSWVAGKQDVLLCYESITFEVTEDYS